jgi:hypothetical protein
LQDACKECKERREQFEARKVSGEIERVGGREDIGERGIENHSGRGEREAIYFVVLLVVYPNNL